MEASALPTSGDTRPDTPRRDAERPLPGLAAQTAARANVELRAFFRNWESVVFTLALPVLLLTVFGAIFQGPIGSGGNRAYLAAGVLATGIMSVSFNNLAIGIAIEQDNGTLKRLAGTPLPPTAYFLGKLAMVLAIGLLEAVLVGAAGLALFDLRPPPSATAWLTLAWVLLLGIAACSFAGVAYTGLITNGRAAAAAVTPPYILLSFISGVWFSLSSLPAWLQAVAAGFPLKWIAQGLRSALLPAAAVAAEPAGAWEHGRVALVLGGWCAAAFLVAILTFRWRRGRAA